MQKYNKKKKINITRLILIVTTAALAVTIGLLLLRKTRVQPIKVYAVSEFVMEADETEEGDSYEGSVRAEGYQGVQLSDTQTVAEILVTEGQTVAKGDALLKYQTGITDTSLQKASIELQRAKLDLHRAYRELDRISRLSPYTAGTAQTPQSRPSVDQTPVQTPYWMTGTGTESDPMYWILDPSDGIDQSFLSGILSDPYRTNYMVLLHRENNALNGTVLDAYGLIITYRNGQYVLKFYHPEIPYYIEQAEVQEETEAPDNRTEEAEYTAAELTRMRVDAKQRIKALELQVRLQERQYQRMAEEASGEVIASTEDGVVKKVRSEAEAKQSHLPIIEVSAGGGLYIDTQINEYHYDEIQEGDAVTVTPYYGSSGGAVQGRIVKITTIPKQANDWEMQSGAQEMSCYPVTVLVDESASLSADDYVSVRYGSEEETDRGLYLDKMFLFYDGGAPYVYKKAENGQLMKQKVTTGKTLYGTYIRINKGLDMDDRIAFPYEKHIRSGAETKDAGSEELYGTTYFR